MLFAVFLAAVILLASKIPGWLTGWLSTKTVDELYALLHRALILVIVGVVIEEWKLIEGAWKFTWLSANDRFREAIGKAKSRKHELIEGTGFLILVVGLAAELEMAPLIETSQETALQEQRNQAADALKKAGELGVDVNNLHTFVDNKEREVANQLGGFKAFASDEKTRADALMNSLNAKRGEVESTIAAAKKDESELRAAADTINDLRQRLARLERVSKGSRLFTEESEARKFAALLSKFTGKKFWVLTETNTRDPTSEPVRFAIQLERILSSAGWKRAELNWPSSMPVSDKGIRIGYRADSTASREAQKVIASYFEQFDIQTSPEAANDIDSDTFIFIIGLP